MTHYGQTLLMMTALLLAALPSHAQSRDDAKILEFSSIDEIVSRPEATLLPQDTQAFEDYLQARDQKTQPEQEREPNFSLAAARRRSVRRDHELRIGVLLPEERLDTLVELMHSAAQMAFFDSKKQDARLFFYDVGSDDKQTRKAIQQASRDDVDIILGPLFAESVAKVAPLAGAEGVPMIVFSNSENVAERGVYVFGLTPKEQTKQMIRYALAQKSKKLAILTPASEYGRIIAQSAEEMLQDLGAAVSSLTFYDETSTDLSQQVRQFTHYDFRKLELAQHKKAIDKALESNDRKAMKALRKTTNRYAPRSLRRTYKNLSDRKVLLAEQKRLGDVDTVTAPPFDTIIVAVSSSRILQTITSLLSFYDVNTQNMKIYGLQLWDEMRTLKNDSNLRGARHITIDSPAYQSFRKRYRSLFGRTPPTLASLVYDAVTLALTVDQQGRIDSDILHNLRGYSGVGSHFRFLSDGTVERLYGIKLINGEDSRVIQTPPNHFPSNY